MSAAPAEFTRRLVRALEGEHFGEAMFSELARRWSAPAEIEALRTLALLEQRMGQALAALVDDEGIEQPDPAPNRERGVDAAAGLSERSWSEFLAEFVDGTRHTLEGYGKLRGAAPDPDHPTLVLLTDHEVALRDFAERAQHGADDELAPVHDVLQRLHVASP